MSFTLRDTFENPQLPCIPRVTQELSKLIKEPKIQFSRFANTIRYDPALVCGLLRAANEKVNGVREISSVTKAIQEIGSQRTLELLMKVHVLKTTDAKNAFQTLMDFGWSSCVSHAIAAESFKKFGCENEESTLFLVGLLCEFGVLHLIQTYPKEYYHEVFKRVGEGKSLSELEHQAFGFSHVTVGHELGRRWRLGEVFSSAILQHQNECNGNIYTFIAQSARKIIELLDGHAHEGDRETLNTSMEACFRISPVEIDEFIDEVDAKRRKIIAALGLSPTRPAAALA